MPDIKTIEHMREELTKMVRRMRITLNALSLEVGSNTVQDFVTRPHKRKSITMTPLFSVFKVVGHELVASRPDMPEFRLRSNEDLKEFFRALAKASGKGLSTMSEEAKVSLTIVTWVTGSSRAQTVNLESVLKILNHQKVALKLRKILPTKAAGKRAALSGS